MNHANTYTLAYIHTYVHTYIPGIRTLRDTNTTHAHLRKFMHVQCQYTHIHVEILEVSHENKCIHSRIHTYIHACMHIYLANDAILFQLVKVEPYCMHAFMYVCMYTCMCAICYSSLFKLSHTIFMHVYMYEYM